MSSKRKFNRKSKYTLSQKIVSAVTAAGFIMQPLAGFANNIIRHDGTNLGNNDVTHIWAEKVVNDNVAINRFEHFQLDAGKIANMYFNEENRQGADVGNLVNFVNDRIDINGTVNAVKDNAIGGNLFFLSKDGMAVGKSGVINTGSLYVMTPTQDFMDTVQTIADNAPADTAADKLGYITNITNDAKAWEIIPVNASGTITVLGQVNATNEVQMRAAKIGVGKNVDDEVVDGVAAGAIVENSAAHIKTGVTDFADIVKLDDEQRKEAGITNLTATKTGSGDIVLEAYVDNASKPNSIKGTPVVGGILSGAVEWGEGSFDTQNFDASVDVYGTVNAAGKADVTATAVNSNAKLDENDNYVSNGNSDVAQLANVNANVNIGGKVTADGDVNVKAEAINRYVDNTGTFGSGTNLIVGSVTPVTVDAAYSKLDTEANVTIANGATVESTGGSVDIDAKAETLAASAASATGLKFKTLGGVKGANVPASAVVYTDADNDANVAVNGTVRAKNDVNIDADAKLTVEAENKMSLSGDNANRFAVGVTIANAGNNAKVDISGEGSSVTATEGNLKVNAKAESDFTSNTSVTNAEASSTGIAINVTEFDSSANVNVDTALTADNNLTVNANNTIENDTVAAETKVGSGKYMSSAFQVMGENGSIDVVKGFASSLAGQLGFGGSGDSGAADDIKTAIDPGKAFEAGATITYSDQSHKSGVTIGNNANLDAKGGKLDIDAQTKIVDAHFTATGATYDYNDTTSAPVDLNAAVLVTNMDNSSSVVVKDAVTDEKGTHNAQLSGRNGVDINASTRFEYNRIDKMKEAVTDAAAQIENAFTTLGDAFTEDFGKIPDEFNELKEKYEAAYKTFSEKMNKVKGDETMLADGGDASIGEAITAGYNVLTALDELNTLLESDKGSAVAENVSEAVKGAADLFTSALDFVDPNSYGTFAASSASKGSSGNVGGSDSGGDTVVGAVGGNNASAINGTGSVMVNSMNSSSKVEIGSGAVIESTRDVNLGAENYIKDVSLGGLNTGLFSNSGGGTTASIGATVNYADFATDTIVAVNDGAEVIGGGINVNANNEINHVSVAGSAGKGPSSEAGAGTLLLNGMLSIVNGSSDILAVVDDGAKLTANQNEYTEPGYVEGYTQTTSGAININGHNNTNITNVAAGAAWGHGEATMGVGLAYTDFDVKNITGVADVKDQIKGLYTTEEHYTDKDGKDAVKYVVDEDKVKEFEDKLDNKYDGRKAGEEDGGISAYDFSLDAATDGSIQSVSAAGTLSNDDASGKIGFFDELGSGLNKIDQYLVGTGGLVDKASSALTGSGKNGANVDDVLNTGTQTHGGSGGISVSGEVNTYMPSFSLAGSGSVSVNMLDNATQAIVDNAKITINKAQGKEKGDITVTARDTLYAGSYSGAASIQWNSGGQRDDTAVGVSGAAGVNDITNSVKATVKNSSLSGAGKVDTMALSGGQQLALGLGLAVVKADGTTGYSGNAAVSVNLIDHDVEALQENNTVTNTDDVNVYAYARDNENTGGGTFSGGQQKAGGGVTVGVAQLNNNISAGIKGGTYTDVESVDVQALNALQSVTVGAAAGVAVNEKATANVQGAGVYNSVHNTTNAFISGTDDGKKAVITTKDGGTVNVTAQDTAENTDLEWRLAGLADGRETIMKFFSLGAGSYYDGLDLSAAGEKINLDKSTGSSIVTVGASVSGTNGKAAVGGAAAITDIENNYTATIDNADITTETLTADAGSDSNIVTVAGGVAVAGKGSGVGSVSWNDVDNTAKVNIQNAAIKAQNTTATAENTAQIVSVTGQISGGGKAAVGAAIGYVGLDNSTEANITNTTFDKRDASETEGTNVKAEAKNSSDSYNIGAGVSAAGKAAVSGTVVVTQTKGTAGAVMDGAKINNAKEIIAHASDDTDILSVIGTVNIAGTAAVGASVAYTEIGGVSTDKEKAEQHVTAEIKNSTINTAAEGTKIEAKAEDNSKVTNIAIGVGGSGRVAVQGASATTLINKATTAGMTNTQIDAPVTDEEGNSTIEGSQKANVTVDAQNNSEITSSADTASVAGQGVAAGAGIAVNRIIQQTNADVSGGTMNVNNLTVNANGTPRIENVGIGIAVAAQGAGATGSVAVNMIENNVTAHIGSGANIVADGSVGVVATSDEQIATYAGQAAVAGQGAGVGISVAVNEIGGTTSATVGGEEEAETSIIAKGNDSIKTNTKIDVDKEINDALIDGKTVGMDDVIDRQEEERSGLIVDASSTRDMKSFLITAGVAGMGAGVAGTVNVNQINGGTNAGITNTTVNGGSANTANAGNVTVNAGDYSNMSGYVGSVGVGGIGAGAGLASDTNTISRDVTAKVENSDIKAQGFELDADSAQGVSSFGTGVGAAGIGGGVAGVVTVTELDNTTKTMLNNSKVNANTVNIKANHTGIVNAGNVSVGGAGLGVGGGLSVGVLKDNSTTEVTVKGDKSEEDTITASDDVTIAANNNVTVNPMISANGVGAFGGVAGATSINNLNSTVKTNIEGVGITSTGGNIKGTADNTFNVKAYMGTIGGGAVGVGAGVTVNTIDSTVQTNVNGSALDAAKDITLTAQETRNIEQTATNVALGGLAVGANIAVTNVGEKIDENSDEGKKITEANDIFGDDASKLTGDSASALATAGIENYTPHVDADFGGGKDSQITVNINSSKLEADSNVTAKATETDNISMTLGGASGGSVAAAAGVGILNVRRNVGVNIEGGGIAAGNTVNVGTDINGKAELNVYQGSAGVYSGNVAYAGVNTTGSSAIDLNGVTIAGKNISITAQDTAKTALQAVGVAAGAVAIGALTAEAANESDVSVNMNNAVVVSDGEETKDDDGNTVIDGGNVTVSTNKANNVTAQAVNTAGGAVGGAGMGATVSDTGSSTIGLTGNTMQADNKIDVNAKTNSTLKADIVNSGAGWFATGAISVAAINAGTEDDYLKTSVTIGEGNTFAANDIAFAANSNISESMDMDALAISAYGAASGNTTISNAYADATVTVDENNTYKGAADDEAGNVNFNANNTVTQTADTSGISASGGFATGTNIGYTTSNLTTKVDLNGSNADSKIADLNANASSYASITNNVNGDGGAIADISPYAAMVHNNYTADTDVEIDGDWNTAGSFGAQAVNGMDIKLKSDAVRAAVIGGSGTWLDNTINNAANVTVNNANITTGGAQNYTAQNNVNYSGEIDGSGYGGINVNATDYSDDIDFTAGVNIKGSNLHGAGDGGSITAFAGTQGSINSKNGLKSAGVIPVALAFSDHEVDYNNSVNVVNSDLTTDKADADITLAATDDTDVKLETIADTQGGVAGAASAEASNNFNRANKINIDEASNLLSTKDINLYAGADANGTKSSLNLQVLADAYNKTAIPVYTDPKVDNSMTQSNQIELAGNAESVRHINASAQKGTTTVTESAQEYKVWTGTGGEGQVASTALGDTIKNEKAYNYVNITGNAEAGIHNELDITIGGQTTTTDPVRDENGNISIKGSVSYDKNNITINAGGDWFTKDDIKIENLTVINGLMERYNQVIEYLKAYDKNSDAYKAYEAEKNLLLLEMQKAGFAEKAGENGELVPLPSVELPAVELPDIVVSGGNINIEADEFKGDGSLTANGAPQLTITNESDMYLKVNDLTISDNGGLINVDAKNKNSFSGTQHADGIGDKLPAITIDGASADKDSFGGKLVQADIGIFGDITNNAGDVKITSDNYNILVNGNVSGRNITIAATKGNITQQSSEGVLNVGNDPIARLQLSEEIAKKIQKYLYQQGSDGSKSFADYQEYLGWLIETVGVTFSDLGLQEDINKYLDYSVTDEEIFNAVDQKYWYLSDLEVQQKIDNAKAGGIKSWKNFLDSYGFDCSYNLGNIESALAKEDIGTIAGGNIYMDAVNINIGGLIQSGYASYSTTLTDADKARVDALDKDWQSNRKVLTDTDVMGNDKYLVNEGGQHFNNETGLWEYEVKVYYNPSTGQLLTESVKPEGGNIQISGKVSSTGGGRIMAMDGTSDVSIDTTAVGKDVKVNSITVNDITGLISIADKNTGKTTQYRNGQQRTFETGTDAESVAWSTGSNSYTYNPEAGSQFAWTGGVSGERIEEYSYTEDFLFWGALPYNKSEDLLEHIAKVDGEIETGNITTNAGDPLKNGSLITGGYNGGDNMLTINWTYRDTGETIATDPHAEKEYDGTAGKIFGYGEFIYTWTETTGDQMASTSGLKADHGIQIGFLGNGEGEGNIKVDSAQDMLLNGNISNATIVDDNNDFVGKGSVTLNSNNGSVSAIGSANINSDDVNITAATGVNVNHSAIGDSANINIATDNGDIKFVSAGGDLNIEQAITGGTNDIDAATGSVYLEAQGSLIDAANVIKGDYAVKGQRIDLISHTGNIGSLNDDGTVANAFRVLGGSDLYSSDTMASSVNAQAHGDIVLTQFDGNMRLGTIVSEDGDAVLTVNDGSFVDAHPSENNDNSSAQDKIDRWEEAGLISDKDGAGESANAAKEAKEERVNALKDRMEALAAEGEHTVDDYTAAADSFYNDEGIKAAKAAYLDAVAEANGDKDKIDAAYAEYQAAQKAYFADKGFSEAEQETITNYAEVANSDNYGWSKNQLLYAIQDSVLNAEPGKDVQTVETPNVTANNITLNAANGGVGIDGAAQVISYDKLNDEATLKLLAQAKAGDLTWNEENQQVTIRQQQAITVSVNQKADGTYGNVNVDANKNVYLAGVKDSQLNITGVDTDGDIRLQGDKGINVNGTLSGEDLTLTGKGDIVGNDNGYVKTDVTGNIYANTTGDINIHHTGDMNLLSIATNQSANLKADGSILMYTDPDTQAQGRINADVVNLTAGGSIGTADNAVRILDNGAVVNADAEQGIYLSGVSGVGSNGELVLGTIEGAGLAVDSVSSVSLGKDATDDEEAVESSITVDGDVSLSAEAGSITQATGSVITANEVNASATENILLGSEENNVNSFVVNGLGENNSIDGSINLAGSRAEGFAADLNGITVNDGSVNVNNYGQGNLNIRGGSVTTTGENAGDVTFTSEGSITANTTVNSAANIFMDADGAITNNGALTAQNNVNVNTTEGAIEIGGSVTAEAGNVNVNTESGDVTTKGEVTGKTDVSINSGNGAINIDGSVTATDNDVNITTGSGAITTTGNVTGGTNVKVDAGTTGTIDLGGDVTAESGDVVVATDDGYIKTTGAVTANNDVKVDTLNGLINLGGLVDAESGFVNVSTANGSITTGGYVSGKEDVNLSSNNGDITVGGYTESETQNVTATVKGDGDINFEGTVSASGDVKAEVEGIGDITTGESAAVSGTDIIFTTNVGDITTGSNLTADKNVDLNVNTGDITFGGDVTANDGNITIDITGDGNLQDAENKDNTLTAISVDSSEDAGNIIIHLGGKGDVDLYDLYATNNARLDIANGNLTLHEIDGELVAMQLRSEGKDMNVGKITAGTQIVLNGSDMSLDDIAQRPDADGMLVVTPNGAADDKPIDNFTIGNITTNTGSGIRFEHLWVNNSDIHIDQGQLWFDKLYVENAAHFSNNEMVAAIYGVPPLRDGSDSVYWNNTAENRPEDNLDMWLNGSGDWMYLRFTDDHIQESNGILLTLDQYDYVYDQRFSAENHLRWMLDRYSDEDYKRTHVYGVYLYDRYGLVDYELPGDENAGEDEIAVEA